VQQRDDRKETLTEKNGEISPFSRFR